MVGLIENAKTDKANKNDMALFPMKISFKIIKESTMTGKSGLGDCVKNKRTGMKNK